MTETREGNGQKAKGANALGPGEAQDKAGPSTSSTSSAKSVAPGQTKRRRRVPQGEVEGLKGPETPRPAEEEGAPSGPPSREGTLIERWMGAPSFRKLVISRLLKKLR